MKGYIYCIQENGKVIYVGCTKNLSKRIMEHVTGATHISDKQQPIHKHMYDKGIENFEFKILKKHDFLDNDDMYRSEAEYINLFGTYKNGFNYNSGGTLTGEGTRNPNARPVICVTTGERFGCVQEACFKFGLGITEMSSHLTGKRYKNGIGKRKLGMNYIFEYENKKGEI